MTRLISASSTGGFTQVLLERGASHVSAVDVGHGQLHASLLVGDPRVDNLEGVNAWELDASTFGGRRFMVLVSDVSFISLKIALPPALNLASAGCFCLLLVKPRLEAGPWGHRQRWHRARYGRCTGRCR